MNSNGVEHIPTLVMKFGGTSVGSADAIGEAVRIVSQTRTDWPRLVVVSSAMSGVTNVLLDSAVGAIDGPTYLVMQSAHRLGNMHHAAAEALLDGQTQYYDKVKREIDNLVAEFTNLCNAIAILGEATPRALDAVASLGERLSVRLLTAVLEARDVPAQVVDATQLIVTDREFQAAHPDLEETKINTLQVLEPILAEGKVPVVTGFIAATPEGITTTLGRGGSDYTAAIIGAILPADEVWLWTDVDGVMTADPRMVPEARTIRELSYREVSELAYFGAKVVHPKTIRPVVEAGIGLRVCNTFNPLHPGTRLTSKRTSKGDGAIKAVTAIRGQCLVTVEGRGMLGVPGVAARTFTAVAETGTSVPLITQASSEQSICFSVPVESSGEVIEEIASAFVKELGSRDIDRIWASEEVVIITVVGAGIRHTPGVAGKIFGALGASSINVIAIAQGSSDVSISLVVNDIDAEKAVKSLHNLIIEREK